MKKMKYKFYPIPGILIVFILNSCSTFKNLSYTVQAGINKGGITENTDLTILPGNAVEVDAFTGATKTGFNAGLRTTKTFNRTQLETGVDYMLNNQTFSYNDAVNNFNGNRKLAVSQLMVPLTWNILLLKNYLPRQELKVKVGVVGQYNSIAVIDTGVLPEYSINPFSAGATLGFAAYPVVLSNGNKVGFFVEGYRGSRIYKDFYNQEEFEMPGSSFAKFGISFQF